MDAMVAVLLYCLGEDDDEDDDNKHSTACTYDVHLLQKERQEGKDVKRLTAVKKKK